MQNENRSSLYWQSEYLYLEQGCLLQIRKPGALLLTPLCKWCFVASCEARRLVCFVFPSTLLLSSHRRGGKWALFLGTISQISNSPPTDTHPPSPPRLNHRTPHPLSCFLVADQSGQSVRFVVWHGECVLYSLRCILRCCVSVCVCVNSTLVGTLKSPAWLKNISTHTCVHIQMHTYQLALTACKRDYPSLWKCYTEANSARQCWHIAAVGFGSGIPPPPTSPPFILNLCFMKPVQAICKTKTKNNYLCNKKNSC